MDENTSIITMKRHSTVPRNTYKLHSQRWLILAAYCILSLAVAPTSTCFTAVSNVLQYYYDVQPTVIHMTLGVFVIACLFFTLPASFILHKYGLAVTLKMAVILHLVGSTIRYFAYHERFGCYMLLTGNSFSALSLASYMFLTAKIAANWFGEHEKGTAIGIGIGFDMVAVGIGFLHSTCLIANTEDKNHIEHGLKQLLLHQLIAAIIATIAVFVFVKDRPRNVPSLAEDILVNENNLVTFSNEEENNDNDTNLIKITIREEKTRKDNFWTCIKGLFKHRSFLIIAHVTSVTASLEITYEMILNDTLTQIFPGKEREIGIVGFTAVILGFISNIVAGIVIDKTKAYKTATSTIFSLTAVFIIIWMILLEVYHSFIIISTIYCCMIMTATSYYVVAGTHIAIVTYPVSAGTSTMLLYTIESLYIIIVSTSASFLLVHVSILYVNIVTLLITLGAAVASFFITKSNNIDEQLLTNAEPTQTDM